MRLPEIPTVCTDWHSERQSAFYEKVKTTHMQPANFCQYNTAQRCEPVQHILNKSQADDTIQ